ncbi:MAG: hypothetical protein SGILL_004885, partial [Bacillariaceae sp.]
KRSKQNGAGGNDDASLFDQMVITNGKAFFYTHKEAVVVYQDNGLRSDATLHMIACHLLLKKQNKWSRSDAQRHLDAFRAKAAEYGGKLITHDYFKDITFPKNAEHIEKSFDVELEQDTHVVYDKKENKPVLLMAATEAELAAAVRSLENRGNQYTFGDVKIVLEKKYSLTSRRSMLRGFVRITQQSRPQQNIVVPQMFLAPVPGMQGLQVPVLFGAAPGAVPVVFPSDVSNTVLPGKGAPGAPGGAAPSMSAPADLTLATAKEKVTWLRTTAHSVPGSMVVVLQVLLWKILGKESFRKAGKLADGELGKFKEDGRQYVPAVDDCVECICNKGHCDLLLEPLQEFLASDFYKAMDRSSIQKTSGDQELLDLIKSSVTEKEEGCPALVATHTLPRLFKQRKPSPQHDFTKHVDVLVDHFATKEQFKSLTKLVLQHPDLLPMMMESYRVPTLLAFYRTTLVEVEDADYEGFPEDFGDFIGFVHEALDERLGSAKMGKAMCFLANRIQAEELQLKKQRVAILEGRIITHLEEISTSVKDKETLEQEKTDLEEALEAEKQRSTERLEATEQRLTRELATANEANATLTNEVDRLATQVADAEGQERRMHEDERQEAGMAFTRQLAALFANNGNGIPVVMPCCKDGCSAPMARVHVSADEFMNLLHEGVILDENGQGWHFSASLRTVMGHLRQDTKEGIVDASQGHFIGRHTNESFPSQYHREKFPFLTKNAIKRGYDSCKETLGPEYVAQFDAKKTDRKWTTVEKAIDTKYSVLVSNLKQYAIKPADAKQYFEEAVVHYFQWQSNGGDDDDFEMLEGFPFVAHHG